MRRRSERKKSTEVVQSPSPAVKSSRKTRQSTQNEALLNLHKNGEVVPNKVDNEEPKLQSKSIKSLLDSNNGSSEALNNEDAKPNTNKEQKLDTIEEVQTQNENIQIEKPKDKTETCESDDKELSPATGSLKETPHTEIDKNNEEAPPPKVSMSIDETIDSVEKEKEISEEDTKSRSDTAQNKKDKKTNEAQEAEENSKDIELEKAKNNNSQEKTETTTTTGSETTKNLGRHKEVRTQIVLRNNEQENDENDELNPSNEGTKVTRKRRWLSKKTSGSTSQVLAISTDSLKNLISDVKPVPLSDIKLESSSDVEEVDSEREEQTAPVISLKTKPENSSVLEKERLIRKKYENPTRKVAVFNDDRPPVIPTKKETSSILCIKNLVRPFTVLQLKGLLARTGKIVEDRFWIDKIKSKCYVQYETEDQAVETRHALHGVRWPTSNPKCLSVDFGTAAEMDKVMSSSHDTVAQVGQEVGRENLVVGTGWDRDRDRFEFEEKKIAIGRPVREWDVGKREELEIEADLARKREKIRGGGERNERIVLKDGADKERRNEERSVRNSDRKRRSSDPERRRSLSSSPARKLKKKNNDPPLRLLDDLFRKTKTTPCIYWLPLTPEQIAEKEAFRLRRVAEHQERIKQRELEKQKDREREREKERSRRRDGYRSNGRRRSNT